MLRKKVFLYVSFVKSVQFVCAIINPIKEQNYKKSANRTLFQANKFAFGAKIFRMRPERLVFRE